jgi:sarcosine oxidase subunit beta
LQDRDVVVVGGGSTGCSVLFHLAKDGLRPLLIDKGSQLASGQTSRSTAIVRTHYSTEVLTTMALNSYRFFKTFAEQVPGRTAGYVETGLLVGTDARSAPALRANWKMHTHLGIDSRLLEPDQVSSSVEPAVAPGKFSLFAHEPNAGYAEPSTTAASFAASAQERGASVMSETEVRSVRRVGSSGRYQIETSRGPITCGRVVLATGVWSKPVFSRLGVDLPIRVSRHPIAVFGRPSVYRGTRPIIFDFPRSTYYKPDGQDLLFVGTLAAEVDTLGTEADPDAYEEGVALEEAAEFSKVAADAIPAMAAGTYRRGYSGLYDNTPDQHPIIDDLSDYGYPGVYCVVGLSGHGFKLAPEFGKIISSLLREGGFRDYDITVFRLKRFKDGSQLSGRYDVSTIA